MNVRDYHFYRKHRHLDRQDQFNELNTPTYINENSFIDSLERKIQHQNQTINNLIKAVENSRYDQERQIQYIERIKIQEEQKQSQQILEELKSLKQKIKRIEQIPQQPSLFPLYQQQQQYPIPINQWQSQQFQPYYQQNHILQNPYSNQNIIPQQQFQEMQVKKKPREMDTLHKFLLKMLHEKEQKQEKSPKLKKIRQDSEQSRCNTDVEASQIKSSKRQTNNSFVIKSNQKNQENYHKESLRSIASQYSQDNKLNKTKYSKSLLESKNQSKKRLYITPQRLKELQRKFRIIVQYILLAQNWKKLCQNIWQQKVLKFKQYSQENIGHFDQEFNYLDIIDKFYKECKLKKYFTKSWIFTQTIDVAVRLQSLIIILETLFRYLIVNEIAFSSQHITFMKSISLSNGYLLSGHSKFVVNRLELRPNQTLSIQQVEQSQMILTEYCYLQILLPQIVQAQFWTSLTNYKDALKIFISALQFLFTERFYSLPIGTQTLPFNTEFVPCFDFQKNPNEGFFNYINNTNPQYQETKEMPMIGLFGKSQLQPLLLHTGFKKIQELFKQYCELIYSQIIKQ